MNGTQLKISDFYGETTVLKIEHIDKKSMTVHQIWNGQESQEDIVYWHTAEDAMKH